ncbi:hypothetical protein [Stenotrophomonas geniculata]|uniref:hypothetical protein n=1 Tax=Stenotrophomonas geniculata TaxID=86188 RepID=UPI003D2B44F8
MNKAEAVSAIGQVAFEQLETMLEFSGLLYAALGWSLITASAAIAMLIHRLEIVGVLPRFHGHLQEGRFRP